MATAVAVKFEAAYLRALDFGPASESDAATVYAHYVRHGAPNAAEYRLLQDHIFRHIAHEAGRLHLPVHFHTGAGCGSYFKLSGADRLLLESVVDGGVVCNHSLRPRDRTEDPMQGANLAGIESCSPAQIAKISSGKIRDLRHRTGQPF